MCSTRWSIRIHGDLGVVKAQKFIEQRLYFQGDVVVFFAPKRLSRAYGGEKMSVAGGYVCVCVPSVHRTPRCLLCVRIPKKKTMMTVSQSEGWSPDPDRLGREDTSREKVDVAGVGCVNM